MWSGITITCFAASYCVTLGLEISRLFFRLRVRWVVMILFAAAGLLAHTAYLWHRVYVDQDAGLVPLASWYDWCLVVAWVLAATYLGLAIRRPENTVPANPSLGWSRTPGSTQGCHSETIDESEQSERRTPRECAI